MVAGGKERRNQTMECFGYDTRRFFLCGMRLFFGLWLLYVGLYKWVAMGPEVFVGYITADFDKTWSPHQLNVVLAWLILVAEPVLAALLMFMLTLGQTILLKPEVIANWQYLVLTLACAALSDPENVGSSRATK
jgi:hypothetical protein